MSLLELPVISCAGTAAAMGAAQGEAQRPAVQAFISQRLAAARLYLGERGRPDTDGLLRCGRDCLAAVAAWDPEGHAEHLGIARGAQVDPVELFTCANMTDLRDLLLVGTTGPEPDREGCTALLLPPSLVRDHMILAAQTWDLNPSDLDFVVAIHRQPLVGPETWSVTCAGCQSLVGMNALGLWVGTTNLKTSAVQVGVPYLSLLHRAIRCPDRQAALAVLATAPLTAAHSYHFADPEGGICVEADAAGLSPRVLEDRVLVQTNHCQDSTLTGRELEPPTASSQARLARAQLLAEAGAHDPASLPHLFADRSDGFDSISRLPEDGCDATTNACLVGLPARRELWACRGAADRGIWQRLDFCSG